MSSVSTTPIEGLFHVELDVHTDDRGWFKESYQRERLEAAGLPHLDVVQNNVSFNAAAGVTRGIHAEPWDKYISPAVGRVFAAIVDLRAGAGFGRCATFTLGPEHGLLVPRGCGNSFCTLEPGTAYSYLVNAHWSPEAVYTNVNLFDADLAIDWPLPREQMTISARDLVHPPLRDVDPVVL